METGSPDLPVAHGGRGDRRVPAPAVRLHSTVATKSTFRSAFKKQRCLVLADGYFQCGRKGNSSSRISSKSTMDSSSPLRNLGMVADSQARLMCQVWNCAVC